ncbi:MAG: hypothetical protein K8R23_04340 [Chthoniobacter sp.]|nr:hypothetical protein [Chthoniobacter sp.]
MDSENAVVVNNANTSQVFGDRKVALQDPFNEIKANPGCTVGMAKDMGLVTTSSKPAPANMQPSIKAAAQPGFVRVTGSKDYADLVNIYMRVSGTAAWTLIGIRRQKFPFDDQTPLKTSGVAEVREYQARAVVGDDEVGVPSDIVQVTFGGRGSSFFQPDPGRREAGARHKTNSAVCSQLLQIKTKTNIPTRLLLTASAAALCASLVLLPARAQASPPQYVITDLGIFPGGNQSVGISVNSSGTVGGSSTVADGTYHAFISTGSTIISLGATGLDSTASGINASGQVTGQYNGGFQAGHPFFYNGTSFTDWARWTEPTVSATASTPAGISPVLQRRMGE